MTTIVVLNIFGLYNPVWNCNWKLRVFLFFIMPQSHTGFWSFKVLAIGIGRSDRHINPHILGTSLHSWSNRVFTSCPQYFILWKSVFINDISTRYVGTEQKLSIITATIKRWLVNDFIEITYLYCRLESESAQPHGHPVGG